MGSWLHALDIALMLHHYRRDVDAAQSIAAQIGIVGEKNELDDYLAKAKIFDGWCRVERGDLEQGAALLEDGLATMREVGTREDFPVYFSMVAQSRVKQGQVDSAIELLNEGLNLIAVEGMAYWAPEIYRHIAEALMKQPEPDADRIDELLSTAIQVARSHDALALELRAVLSRVCCLKQQGEAGLALTSLVEVSDRVTEGWDTPDLQDAVALLDALKAVSGETSHEPA